MGIGAIELPEELRSTLIDTPPKAPTPMADEDATGYRAWLGRVIDGKYRLDALIAEGGMGAVFEARHVERGEPVASDNTTDDQAAVQFCPEVDGEYEIGVSMEEGGGDFVLTGWSGMPSGGGSLASGGGRGSCASPIPLPLGTTVAGDTTRGTNSMSGSCIRGGDAPELVYAVTLERRAQLSVTITSNYDGALYLLGACGEERSEIACNDDAPTTERSHVEATLDPGTYYVVVDGYASGAGQFSLTAEVAELESLAQVCSGATPLQAGQAVTGSTTGRPSYFTATCAGGARSPDRVYTFDVATRSRMRLRMRSRSSPVAARVKVTTRI